jgi:uncharacterized protein (UPF0332 family)
MGSEPRKEVVRYWWSKAEESLASARREIEAGAIPFALNRIYYAAPPLAKFFSFTGSYSDKVREERKWQ